MKRALPYDGIMILRLLSATTLFLVLCVPSFAQERQWNLERSDNQAFLVFGVADTQDVGVSIWCEIGSGQLSAFLPEMRIALRAGETVPMTIGVDGVQQTLKGTAAIDVTTKQMTVETKFSLKDNLTARLKGGQTLSISVKGHVNTFPFADADFAGLLSRCKGETEN